MISELKSAPGSSGDFNVAMSGADESFATAYVDDMIMVHGSGENRDDCYFYIDLGWTVVWAEVPLDRKKEYFELVGLGDHAFALGFNPSCI